MKRVVGLLAAAALVIAVLIGAASVSAQDGTDPELAPGLELINGGCYDEAATFFEKESTGRPDDPDVFNFLGVARYHLGDFKGALEAFDESLNRDPSYVIVYHNIGVTYHALGRYYLAIENFERALNLTGDDEVLFFRLALSYIALQDWKTAREYLESALRMNPDGSDYRVYLEYVNSKISAAPQE
jgi:tetratricopeptide (TPR) repeat protein